jgi:hypothetical protein
MRCHRCLEVDAHRVAIVVRMDAEALLEETRLLGDERPNLGRIEGHHRQRRLAQTAAHLGSTRLATGALGLCPLRSRAANLLFQHVVLFEFEIDTHFFLQHLGRGKRAAGSGSSLLARSRGTGVDRGFRRAATAARTRSRAVFEAGIAGATQQHVVRIGAPGCPLYRVFRSFRGIGYNSDGRPGPSPCPGR